MIARPRTVQGKSHTPARLPTDADSLEVGVLPQQLLNPINYAAPNLLTSSLKRATFETHGLPPWEENHTGPTLCYKLFPHLGKVDH